MYDNKVKISELTAATNLGDSDVVAGVVNNTTSKITFATLKDFVVANLYSKDDIDQMVSTIPKFSIDVVDNLPETGLNTTLYLVKAAEDGPDMYSEHIFVNGRWEDLGKQTIDLSNYLTKDETNAQFVPRNIGGGTVFLKSIGYDTNATNVTGKGIGVHLQTGSTVDVGLSQFPMATNTNAGAMSAADKVIIDDLPNNYVATANLTLNTQQQEWLSAAVAPGILSTIVRTVNLDYAADYANMKLTEIDVKTNTYAVDIKKITYATSTQAGLLSAADKVKIDNIPEAMTAEEFEAALGCIGSKS